MLLTHPGDNWPLSMSLWHLCTQAIHGSHNPPDTAGANAMQQLTQQALMYGKRMGNCRAALHLSL